MSGANIGGALILVGLILAVVNSLRFVHGRRLVQPALHAPPPGEPPRGWWVLVRGATPAVYAPLGLIWLGFWTATRFNNLLAALPVGLLVGLTVHRAVHAVRSAHHRRGDRVVHGAVMAVILTAVTLLLFGLLLVIRLTVQADPTWGVAGALTADALTENATAVLLPAALLTLAVYLIPGLRVNTTWWDRRWSDRVYLSAVAVIAVLFAAPVLAGGARLTVLGVATPEYGKILYLVVLAGMLAHFASGFRVRPAPTRDPLTWARARRHYLYPILIFVAVGLAGAAKNDFGPMIPLFAGSVAMIGVVLAGEVSRCLLGEGGWWRRTLGRVRGGLGFARPLLIPLVGLIVVGLIVMRFTSYVHERYQAWDDPWSFPWNAVCKEITPEPPHPPGTTICRRPFGPAALSNQSQIAHALAVIADGGLWGRGLDDTTVASLPAKSTDFVLAVIWSKLGGITVALLAVLMALMTTALTLAARRLRGPSRITTPAHILVVGVAGSILGQFLFVLAATVNAVPHAGITAPLLSRGGQSTVALGLGLILAVAAAYRATPRPADPTRPPPPTAPSRRVPAGVLVLAACLALIATRLVSPYSGLPEGRPYCRTNGERVDPTVCSTDRIAFERGIVEITLDGQPQYRRDRRQQTWEPVGTPAVSLADLSGLVRAGGEAGVLDLGLADVIHGGTVTSPVDRLSPPWARESVPVGIDLTVDPGIQTAAARALRADPDPLAGGVVAVDATTGRVLAAAGAPTDPGLPTTEPSRPDPRVLQEFNRAQRYHPLTPSGGLNESIDCLATGVTEATQSCERLQMDYAAPAASPELLAERTRYVGGDQAFDPPGEKQNRVLGRDYGLGSTFKVVVAAAYLNQPGTSPDDLVEAPLAIPSTHPIRNAGGGGCRFTENGRITVTNALAVSCNTAFVKLAERIGWPRVRDTARDLGFVIGPPTPGRVDPAWVAGARIGVDSRVPENVVQDDLGNNVLGGDRVVGTPLQMATVMGAIAGDGRAVQPSLLTTAPGGTREALGAGTVAKLRQALSRTTAEGGTAHGLTTPDGRPLWVKTGTHELFGGRDQPRKFARQNAWVIGFVDTRTGPVSFAVVVETRDERAGAARARSLTRQLVNTIVGARG